jgi:hypothetical protein
LWTALISWWVYPVLVVALVIVLALWAQDVAPDAMYLASRGLGVSLILTMLYDWQVRRPRLGGEKVTGSSTSAFVRRLVPILLISLAIWLPLVALALILR